MRTLQNHFTTPEQSKRLLELGVPADSADCYYYYDPAMVQSDIYVLKRGRTIIEEQRLECLVIDPAICLSPCWSVGRLMEIYDTCVENTESWPVVKQDISYVINIIVAIDYAVKEGRIDFSKLED